MTAKLATVDGPIWARADEAGPVRDGSMLEHSASAKPRVGSAKFDGGYLSPHFVTDPERMEVVFENVYVLIHEKKLSSKNDLLPVLEQIVRSSRPLLIIAEDFGGEALAALVVNKLRGPLQVAAVMAPDSGNRRKGLLQDVALLTGCNAISEDLDLKLRDVQISDLGQASGLICPSESEHESSDQTQISSAQCCGPEFWLLQLVRGQLARGTEGENRQC